MDPCPSSETNQFHPLGSPLSQGMGVAFILGMRVAKTDAVIVLDSTRKPLRLVQGHGPVPGVLVPLSFVLIFSMKTTPFLCMRKKLPLHAHVAELILVKEDHHLRDTSHVD